MQGANRLRLGLGLVRSRAGIRTDVAIVVACLLSRGASGFSCCPVGLVLVVFLDVVFFFLFFVACPEHVELDGLFQVSNILRKC